MRSRRRVFPSRGHGRGRCGSGPEVGIGYRMASESDKKKIVLAVVLLVIAGLAIAWNLGLFSGGGDKAALTKQPEAPSSAKEAKEKGVPARPGARIAE